MQTRRRPGASLGGVTLLLLVALTLSGPGALDAAKATIVPGGQVPTRQVEIVRAEAVVRHVVKRASRDRLLDARERAAGLMPCGIWARAVVATPAGEAAGPVRLREAMLSLPPPAV